MLLTDFLQAFLVVLLVGMVASIGLYWQNREFYLNNRTLIRKIYYVSVVVGGVALWSANNFPFNTIKEFTALAAGIVIIDLFVFQTPDVTKFMVGEFKADEIKENINKKAFAVEKISEKLMKLNESLVLLQNDWELERFDYSYEKYMRNLTDYLKTFMDEFGMDLYPYQIDAPDDRAQLNNAIKGVYRNIMSDLNFTMRDVGMSESQAVDTLEKGESIEVFQKGDSHVIFPYFGKYFNILFVISSRNNDELKDDGTPSGTVTGIVNGADASLLLNMIYTFDLWLDGFITEQQVIHPEMFLTITEQNDARIN
ncbi:type II toxin-antitoxin system SpoIISA family toxin [Planococcus sp. 1R117A]|uniref:type II toxin-antitoxin system SpoIISA family toxin n=1 Tax=Planococcus sp. 1R117A TaxID=3447020 RepID=UPI003EDB792D